MKKIIPLVLLGLWSMVPTLMAGPIVPKMQAQCVIIGIHGERAPISATPAADEEPLEIKPQYAGVPPGVCVVWVNWARRAGISIRFNDGKGCVAATQAPVGFKYVRDKGYFQTGFIAEGETASLRFLKPGTYNYELHIPNRIAPVATGRVTVFEP
jgi:hypothetical protein